ncbi:sporulation related protein [Blastomonas natatoria]|uniref:Sporulation related protein n=1 Tax=Blastomonas natatoria TaxID=34015 RepID=A0A2V3VDR3_9SPHN|nr:SPOR domain-containing protein [Blastomonas natatoria]PXW78971.1 sporulation related protein [Blastomonas natatoria]
MSNRLDNGVDGELRDQSLGLDADDDRLPWLESVDDVPANDGNGAKIFGFVLLGLVGLSIVLAAICWLGGSGSAPEGDGSLIAAPQGDYKVRPKDSQEQKVEGTGDASFAVSQGEQPTGQLADAAGAPPPPGSALVQLGAYTDEASALTGWQTLSQRHEVLKGLDRRIVQATVDGGTVFRLSAVLGSPASANQVCDQLKKAGQNCLVVR